MNESVVPGSLGRRVLAEFIGTGLLVAAVIGSGIAASTLSPDNVGLQLFENAAATAAALVAIILAVGPVCPVPT
jgi:glycerol uptake facilitator-like aquaporin